MGTKQEYTYKTRLGNTSSIIGDFMQERAIKKRNTNQQEEIKNPLDDKQQMTLIMSIFNRCHNVKIDGQKEILLDLLDGQVQHIERNYKNFSTIIKITFRKVSSEGYECINLPKLFEVIKTKNSYSFRTSKSIFNEKNQLVINEARKELINELKIKHNFNINDITKKEYDSIVHGIDEHWQGLIPLILDHIVAGKFVSDKKNLWLLVMADSNFGKSKLFKWIEPFGGSVFMDFKDLTSNDISNKSPDEIEGKMCLVIDEVTSFHRKLFEVEDYLMIRPMRNHAIKIPINSRILLSADGGTFNNEYMDKQIVNRVAVVDLRGKQTGELGDLSITHQHGRYKIALVMTHYLYTQIFNRLQEYRSLNHIERANKADKTIQEIFNRYKQKKNDFFQIVETSLYEILQESKEALDNYHYNILQDAIIFREDGYIIKRPQEIIPKILINYDKSLEYELGYKNIKQIESKISGFKIGSFKVDGKAVRGIFIPKSRDPKTITLLDKVANIKAKAKKVTA
jgi:hypothetical protein